MWSPTRTQHGFMMHWRKNVTNKLITIKGGGHGMFAQPDYVAAFDEIWKFLKENKVQ